MATAKRGVEAHAGCAGPAELTAPQSCPIISQLDRQRRSPGRVARCEVAWDECESGVWEREKGEVCVRCVWKGEGNDDVVAGKRMGAVRRQNCGWWWMVAGGGEC